MFKLSKFRGTTVPTKVVGTTTKEILFPLSVLEQLFPQWLLQQPFQQELLEQPPKRFLFQQSLLEQLFPQRLLEPLFQQSLSKRHTIGNLAFFSKNLDILTFGLWFSVYRPGLRPPLHLTTQPQLPQPPKLPSTSPPLTPLLLTFCSKVFNFLGKHTLFCFGHIPVKFCSNSMILDIFLTAKTKGFSKCKIL